MEPVEPNIANCLFFHGLSKSYIFFRIHRIAFIPQLEMQVRSGRQLSRIPDQSDRLTGYPWSPTSFSNNSLCL